MQSYSSIQTKFNMYHENEYNCIVHFFTTFGVLFSIFGLVHNNVTKITFKKMIEILAITSIFCIICIDTEEKNTIVFLSVLFLFNCIFTMLYMDNYLNSYGYSIIFTSSVLAQELSHVFFYEEAMMYHYDGFFLEDFLTHGIYIVPLIVQLLSKNHDYLYIIRDE
jgi:uncharacterized membrane protein YGL010W